MLLPDLYVANDISQLGNRFRIDCQLAKWIAKSSDIDTFVSQISLREIAKTRGACEWYVDATNLLSFFLSKLQHKSLVVLDVLV